MPCVGERIGGTRRGVAQAGKTVAPIIPSPSLEDIVWVSLGLTPFAKASQRATFITLGCFQTLFLPVRRTDGPVFVPIVSVRDSFQF